MLDADTGVLIGIPTALVRRGASDLGTTYTSSDHGMTIGLRYFKVQGNFGDLFAYAMGLLDPFTVDYSVLHEDWFVLAGGQDCKFYVRFHLMQDHVAGFFVVYDDTLNEKVGAPVNMMSFTLKPFAAPPSERELASLQSEPNINEVRDLLRQAKDNPSPEPPRHETFDGKCRGFPQLHRVGMPVDSDAHKKELGPITGLGPPPCELIPGSEAETRVRKECPYGSPCEVDAKLRVNVKEGILEIEEAYHVRSWESWKGTCYGAVHDEGDGEISVGVLNADPSVPCGAGSDTAEAIIGECPVGSICQVNAKFESQPTGTAWIGYVDSAKMKEPPTPAKSRQSEPNPDVNSPLGMCSAAIQDPLRPMIIDRLISGGKHISPGWTATIKSEIEADYGSFLTVRDDATVERVEKATGKIGCAVSYVVDLQGLAGKVLEEGATARAQILIRQIAREGKIVRGRLDYTVQKTSGGSLLVSFGLPSEPSADQRVVGCLVWHAGRCAIWGTR